MKTSHILAAAAISILAAAGAQAETYDGVQASVSAKSRDEVNAEAVRAAAAVDQNIRAVRVARSASLRRPTRLLFAHKPSRPRTPWTRTWFPARSTTAA